MKVLRQRELNHQQMTSKNGEPYSRSATLSNALESKDFFIHHEILQPGRRSSASHFHIETEEVVYVLKGRLTAHEDDQSTTLEVGDSVCFYPDSKKTHHLANDSKEIAEFLVINRKLQSPDVVFSITE